MTAPARHSAGQVTYPGDVTRRALGQVMGPTTYGSLIVAVGATYDETTDRTVVEFAHCTEQDAATIVRTGRETLDVTADQ